MTGWRSSRSIPIRRRNRSARPPGAAWQVARRVDHPDPAAANAERCTISKTAAALDLVFAGAIGAHGYGLPATTEAAVARALDGVDLSAIAIELDIGPNARTCPPCGGAREEARPRRLRLVVRFGLDPLGVMAVAGETATAWPALASQIVKDVQALAAQGFKGPFMAADGRVVHNAGGSEAQELAYVLSVGVAYLRALEAGGVALDAARKALFFRLTADVDQFLHHRQFRALPACEHASRTPAAEGHADLPLRRDRLAHDDLETRS